MYTKCAFIIYKCLCKRLKCKKLLYKKMAVIHSYVFCVSYKYVKSLF